MKLSINKSAKRVLSITLALVMLVGTLFTANVGTTITANAETATIEEGTIDLLEFGSYLTDAGSTSTWYDTNVADNGEAGTAEEPIIIDSAEEFVYLCKGAANDATKGKYYKVADGIAGFDLSGGKITDYDGTLADQLANVKASGKNHAGDTTVSFQGHFDGNGATVYGAWCSHTSVSTYAGLFSCTKGDVTIKNVNVKLASFTAKNAVGGIVGYHTGDGTNTLTIENCSVTDSHLELTELGSRHAIGALVGLSANLSSYTETETTGDVSGNGKIGDTIYVNGKCLVSNCFVNLDPTYFASVTDPDVLTDTTQKGTFGGVVGAMTSNGLAVDKCVVIGVTPYTTQVNTSDNEIQHSGLAIHYTNIYTTEDVAVTSVKIGGTLDTQNFTGIHPLSTADMQGAAAVNNMSLEWFTTWIPGADGQYPTLNQTGAESDTSFWTGSAATEFAGGTGTKEDPFIIKTADQLYLALTKITGSTSTKGDLAVETAGDVAGGYQSDRILKQGSTTVYVPVYTPYYYKVADGVKAFYLNSVYGSETLDGAKAMAATSTKKDWKPGKSFVGYLDGNGVTIYGMYSSTGQGLVYKLDGSSTVKNFNFDACYSTATGNCAMVTTNLGTYNNDTTLINISNISVRNSYLATTRAITVTQRTSAPTEYYEHNPGPAGIVSSNYTAENLTISNCLYDGISCERAIGSGSDATIDMIGGIISGTHSMNNTLMSGCVALGAPIANEVYVEGKEVYYNRYDATQGYPVYFNDCYTDIALNEITTAYPDKYDKLAMINRVSKEDVYDKFDMPTLAWGSNWALVAVSETRTIPMPTVSTAEETLGSYASVLGSEAKTGKYASVGPYKGTNPYTYTLKGSGTEADPFIIETDIQLARAIATGGMNLYDKLYYKLGNDIDLSGGLWINQTDVSTSSSTYTYTPFGGVLDGNGHVITGLSAGDTAAAGLIPVLAGGTVKNLHIRNASVISSSYAGAIVGEILAEDDEGNPIGGTITGCSVEDAEIIAGQVIEKLGIVGYHDDVTDSTYGLIEDCYYIGTDFTIYISDFEDINNTLYNDLDRKEQIIKELADRNEEYTSVWYIGGTDGSLPRLKNLNSHANDLDIVGDGKADGYSSADLTALRNKLLKRTAYANINGDVSRDGKINLVDLAVLQRTIVNDDATLTDSFFRNVEKGQVKIYYGENDNYDAARKVELYLESLFDGVDVVKCVSSSKGTVTGAESDNTKVYLHEGDKAETPDGQLDIIIGNLDNVTKYATNDTATADNTYAVTYDSENKVVWLQGANFTAVEQAAINFVNGSSVDGDVVYTVGSTELENYKKPITVQLDTNFDGTVDTPTTYYYAWGDEFDEDTLNTYNWQHNNHQTEGTQGSAGSYNNLEMVPVKDLGKVLVVSGGKLSMKRAHDSDLGEDVTWTTTDGETIVGSVALDVTPGEYNGYAQWTDNANGANSIDTDGSDQYLTSGKVTTERGMLYKQGYLEFEGRLPADGHAFPAWWLMGRPAQSATNNGYDNSLYGKVYKLNSKWDGVTDAYVANDLNTYKYQIPTAVYEIDMIEVMQHSLRHQQIAEKSWLGEIIGASSYYNNDYKTRTEAVYLYYLNSTIHKWWNNGTQRTTDGNLYIQDWDNYKVSTGIANDSFKTTSSAGSWIHNIGSTQYDFGTATQSSNTATYWDTDTYQANAHNKLTAKRKYGFSWNTNGSGFEATLYIYDGDTLTKTVPIASGMSDYAAFKDSSKNAETSGIIGTTDSGAFKDVYSDAKVFNQYMYVLLDNKYYSSNDSIDISNNSSASMFTDLLKATGLKSFELEYVRVYQEDGYRDIVTPETQDFNNNNHFGYN